MIVGARVGVALAVITTASPDATEVAVGDGTAVVATEGEVGATALHLGAVPILTDDTRATTKERGRQ